MTAARFDRRVQSDGMTIDAHYGPVDLVAVDRIRHGHATPLTKADRLHLNATMQLGTGETELICEALGIQLKSLLRRGTRVRQANDKDATASREEALL